MQMAPTFTAAQKGKAPEVTGAPAKALPSPGPNQQGEVQYPQWLTNVVMVKKTNGKWRMCIDFRTLNLACPKDTYPLPRINMMVDRTFGYEVMSFLDAFFWYHQIRMAKEDEEKTAFITDFGTYCYNVMPFGLKNAGATYQRMIDVVFRDQRGRNLEAYVDDILVKSKTSEGHLGDLMETLDTLRSFNLKLNLTKCTFGIASGKFLVYLVSSRGIKANPDKISVILNMPSPKTAKEIQKLAGRISSLGRFILKAGDRCSPFFRCLRNNKGGQWTNKCEAAFTELKKYLTLAPILVAPKEGAVLSLYLGVSDTAVSAVLLDDDKRVQQPIFYISHILVDAESRYPTLEKLALALLVTARKLRLYFMSHTIQIVTDQPLLKILHTPKVSGRLLKWSIELGDYDIKYVPQTSIKAQALADFVAELSTSEPSLVRYRKNLWSLYVDGASGSQSLGAGILLTSPMGATLHQAVTLRFKATNNQVEYETLIAGLNFALSMAVRCIQVFSDFQLVVNQVNRAFETKDEVLKKYLQQTQSLISQFEDFSLTHIPKEENQVTDRLAKVGLPDLRRTQVFERPNFECTEIHFEEHPPCWMDRILNYLKDGAQPDNRQEAKKLKLDCAKYVLINRELYRRSYAKPLTKCLWLEEAQEVIEAVHKWECETHARG
ncbi:RNA-directed DNA polymerase like [Apostasia shenzhenica]|uniref:RNA-directed DNA polymerase like n=1 Tax=Apostasia shenzhenica TaxID=1088818 RepID=A0A2I0AYM2_9ASPA|nr:RNA-directed DNA polymerase like [Apostasia shenzhenica]